MTEQSSPESIFELALQCTDPEERTICLEEACRGNEELRREVESLLAAHDAAGSFLEPLVTPEPAAPGEQEGDRIGRYKLLELIGEGGFGRVWMAEQTEPVQRRVALKIVKLGMDTGEVLARFEAERQALAIMDHPHIARVFDGGATDTGRPYFVMELVRGVPITTYCDANKLPPRARIELFEKVCRAVQHAHQKGIIHRDLKPTNILVTVQDDQPVPKVIDFGVAKALQTRLTERTLFTRFNQWIGTPVYMSPEQAGLGSLDIDVRSDIYSLGTILYELLTGHTPFDQVKLREEGYDAMLRTIREEDPPRPSTRLSSLSRDALHTVAGHRGESPEKLGREIRGELDWILLKALDRDRSRRYESANHLADELGRFSANEPISAVPPSFAYRARKHLRKHPGHLAALAGFALLLMASGSAVTWLAMQPRPQPFKRTGKPLLATLRGHDDAVIGLTHLPRHDVLVSCGSDGTINHWSSKTGELLASFEAHDGRVWDVAFSRDGNTLALEGYDGTVLLRDNRGKQAPRIFKQQETAKYVKYPPWETRTPWETRIGGGRGNGGGQSISFAASGKALALCSNDWRSVDFWSLETGNRIASFVPKGTRVRIFALSPNEELLAFAGPYPKGTLGVFHVASGELLWLTRGDPRFVVCLAFSPDGKILVAGSTDISVRLWNSISGKRLGHGPSLAGWVQPVAFFPDGRSLAYSGGGKLFSCDVGSLETPKALNSHYASVFCLTFFANGQFLATAGTDRDIKIWDAQACLHPHVKLSRQRLEEARKDIATRLSTATAERGRYVKFFAEETTGGRHACVAEFRLMDSKGALMRPGEIRIHGQSGMQVAASNVPNEEEKVEAPRRAELVLDEDPDTFWQSSWRPEMSAPFPHWIVFDLGRAREIGGFLLKHRRDWNRDTDIRRWRIYMSDDAEEWKEVAAGDFENSVEWQGRVFDFREE